MYNNVNVPSAQIRREARNILRGNWETVALIMFLFVILSNIVPALISAAFTTEIPDRIVDLPGIRLNYNESLTTIIESTDANGDIIQDITSPEEPVSGFSEIGEWLSSIYDFFFTGVFEVGLCCYMLAFCKGKEATSRHLFHGFNFYLKTLVLMLVTTVFTLLWALLLIVPGIIAAIRYSQAYFILADDPNKGVMQCLEESKAMMKGNKAKYFWLNVSFAGWYILSWAVSAVIGTVVGLISSPIGIPVVTTALDVFTTLPGVVLLVYTKTTNTVFYDLVSKETDSNYEDGEHIPEIPVLQE